VLDKDDAALKTVVFDAEKAIARGNSEDLATELGEQQSLLSPLESLRLADAAGRLRFGLRVPVGSPPISIADRDYFTLQRDRPDAGLVIDGPVFGRVDKEWMIVLSRRLNQPDGRIAGVVYAAIQTERFQRLFSAMQLGAHGSITLRTADFKRVTTYPASAQDVIGSGDVPDALRSARAAHAEAGSFVATSAADGIERAFAYRKLPGYPFYVEVGLATADYMVAWRDEAYRIWALAGLAVILCVVAGCLLRRSWAHQAGAIAALARESRRNQLLLLNASDGVHILDAAGRVLEVSDAFCNLLGYRRSELLQMNVAQWDTRQSAALLTPGASGNRRSSIETRYRRQNGALVDVDLNITRVEQDERVEFYVSAHDITQRKQAEAALRNSEMHLHMALSGADMATWDWHIPSGALNFSARWAEIQGLAPTELLPRVDSWSSRVHPDDMAQVQCLLDQHFTGQLPAYESEHRVRHKDGHWVWVNGRGKVVEWDAEGKPLRAVGTAVDITERKRREAELVAARQAAENANHAKSRFLAAASHDLRQPLASLALYVGVLKNRFAASDRLMGNIGDCVDSLSELLTKLLDVSKLDAGVVRPRVVDFALDDLLTTLVSLHAGEADLKGLRLHARRSGLVARSDPTLLQRILGNLVTNAIRYTDQGGVLIACRRHHGKHWITVWDTGIGIPEDQSEVIFEEFRQLGDNSRNRGSGLGLAIVAKMAQLLGLQIRLRSRPGRGSMFAIELPLGRALAAVEQTSVASSAGRLRIGLVDDNPQVLQALVLALQQPGHEIIAASSGQTLLERLGRSGPDVVISDYRLQGTETGFDVIGAVRQAFGADLPALLITGDTDPEVIRRMAARGIAVHYKPVQIETLLAFINEMTERS
jgi:PAS domain S-box-containing protein